MNLSEYYKYQAKARNLNSVADVLKVVDYQSSLYDQVILPWLPKHLDASIYEAACGPGIMLHWLKRRGYANAIGSDSSDVQISLAIDGGLAASLADSIGELQRLPPASLDCLIALDFYEHLPKESVLDFLAIAHNVLKAGGSLILRGPNGDSPVLGRALYNDITHVSALTSVAFHALLTMAGFRSSSFKDDTVAGIQRHRWIKVPLAHMCRAVVRVLLRFATRENILYLSASFFIRGVK